MIALLIAGCALSALFLTGAALRYALSRNILDIPNERSSHIGAVPRGGGLAIVVAAIAGTVTGCAAGWIDARLTLALCGGGGLVALIGWMDDRRHVSPGIRSLVHLIAATWVVWIVGGMPSLRMAGTDISLGLGGSVLAVVGIVWSINLYNFMDGIDGLAAGEAVAVGAAAAALCWYMGSPSIAICAAITAAAAGGFLAWNWAPARIFMGDIGSGFLGLLFGALAVASETRHALPLTLWVVLCGVFVFDATVTLTRRVKRGERWYAAHRSHAYQRAVQSGLAHAQVTTFALLITVGLAALVWIAVLDPRLEPLTFVTGAGALAAIYRIIGRAQPMEPAEGSGERRDGGG